MIAKKGIVAVLLIFWLLSVGHADWFEKNSKIVRANLIGSAAIVSWGYFTWDYGTRKPHFAHEGWFGKDTKHAGMDKLGHLYTNYAVTHLLAALFRGYGYPKGYAAKSAALSAFFLNGVMEVGDSFGTYGFSVEDVVFNAIGAYLGYRMLTSRELDRTFDLRVEYFPSERVRSGRNYDIFTDYQGMKFLTALKLEHFAPLRRGFLQYLELQAGYYARRVHGENQRYPYLGIGINFSKLLRPVNKKAAKFFEFYQPPLGALRTE